MNLAHTWILHFLWLVPITALLFIVYNRQRTRAMERFAEPRLLDRLTGDISRGRRIIRSAFLLAALGLMLLALAGPRWGSHYQEVSQKGVDIMIVLDVSSSMLVSDVKPDRLERARREITDFIKVVQGDRVGLVAFSGVAFTQCPLTLDYGALGMFLNALGPDLVPVPGTDLGAAIETAISSFDTQSETDRVILLITDGEDNENKGLQAAREAAKRGIKIFVFGIGDPSGGPVPAGEGKGGFKKDKDGNLILSKLNEEGLSKIASITGGSYIRSVAGDLDLDLLYFEGIRSKTEAATLKSGKIKVYEERFIIFVIAAFLFLLLEGLIGFRELMKGKGERRFVIFFLVVMGLFPGTPALASEDPDELYRLGRFAEAEKIYANSDMDNPKDLRYRYNRGCASYQGSDYKGAMASFSSVLRRAEDSKTQVKAAYNLGNTAFKQGDFASAAAHYKKAILIDPESENARFNLEIALRKLEKQKKEEKEGQKCSGKEENKKNQPKDGKNGEGEEESSSDKSAEKKGPQDKDQQNKKMDNDPGQEKKPDEEQGAGQDKAREGEQGPPKDLSGDLRPREALPQREKDEDASQAVSLMDRKKAEALLDNVKEDRSKYLEFQTPRGKRRGVLSGKDW